MLQDFSPGPLDSYRKKASFDWKEMKIFIDTAEGVSYEAQLLAKLKLHQEFQERLPTSLSENRRSSVRRLLSLTELEEASIPNDIKSSKKYWIFFRTLIHFNPSMAGQYVIQNVFFKTLQLQGTEQHHSFIKKAQQENILGCLCMTEVLHGSNVMAMKTRATFDKIRQVFILNTPDFKTAKCWPSGLGQTASYAVVLAQLYTDGVCHGVHSFLVPIRDPKTLVSLPGLIVGDIGEKIGINGVDNGFLIFNNYCIPKSCLLNKYADVTPGGKYVNFQKNSQNRHGAALSSLSLSRGDFTASADAFAAKAIAIAVRYAAVRKITHKGGTEGTPILELQSTYYRLMPSLATCYAIRLVTSHLIDLNYKFYNDLLDNDEQKSLFQKIEFHVISCGSKAVSGWFCLDIIKNCQEICGSHGYLKAAGIGDVRNDFDSNSTAEGDNTVILQQVSNILLKLAQLIESDPEIEIPLQSANFLSNNFTKILDSRFKAKTLEEVMDPKTIIPAYQWLICYHLKQTKLKYDELNSKEGRFWAKNNAQVFAAKSLATTFIQHFFLQRMLAVISTASALEVSNVLLKLFSLFGLVNLQESLSTLYQGGYVEGPQPTRLIQSGILQLSSEIKDDAVALVDAIAPDDFLLGSVLGTSDGNVYERMKSCFCNSDYNMVRPSWWLEVVNWKTNKKSKL